MIESSSSPRTLPAASGIIVAMFCVLRSLCLSSGVFSVCRGEIGRSEQNAMLVVAMRAPGRRRASAGREREKSSRVFLIGREQRERKKEKSRRRRRTHSQKSKEKNPIARLLPPSVPSPRPRSRRSRNPLDLAGSTRGGKGRKRVNFCAWKHSQARPAEWPQPQ